MNVYLLPHHRLDPRFRYTLEREAPADKWPLPAPFPDSPPQRVGFVRRQLWRIRHLLRRLRHDYDQMVHGREQIRLSQLLLEMDRDPELTLVIPAGMTREWALVAVRGVIQAGFMAHRSHAIRNVSTAVLMFIILFFILPLHVTAVIFLPLILLYAWRRYWEDRLIRRIMKHLIYVRLEGNAGVHFREDPHLTQLEQAFDRTARPDAAYMEAITYLDRLDQTMDSLSSPEHVLLYGYYRDIGRLDPYERYQDRMRKKLAESLKLMWQQLSGLVRDAFRWTFGRTHVAGVRMPNWMFVLVPVSIAVMVFWFVLALWSDPARAVERPASSIERSTHLEDVD